MRPSLVWTRTWTMFGNSSSRTVSIFVTRMSHLRDDRTGARVGELREERHCVDPPDRLRQPAQIDVLDDDHVAVTAADAAEHLVRRHALVEPLRGGERDPV